MKLIIDIPVEEFEALSKMSEKEKVNELSYYERVIASGEPYDTSLLNEIIKVMDERKQDEINFIALSDGYYFGKILKIFGQE